MRVRKFLQACACIAVCAAAIGMTALAYWNVTGKTINILTMASYRAEITEQYEIPQSVSPGVSVNKTVHVKNSGTADLIVRVKLTRRFGTREADGLLTPDDTLDPELIELECSDTYWKYLNGYWYYKEVLEAGESTKEPLLKSYRVSERADNRYKGKDAEIVVTMDSVQADSEAVTLWGVREKDLGIHYVSSYETRTTRVIFAGKEDGFSFDAEETDLFASFKNLTPGCSRTQEIEVVNTSSEAVTLYLAAEAAKQDQMSAQQLKLVNRMLQEYAVIEVKEEDRLLYSGPVSGSVRGENMREAVSLGIFAPKEQKKLTVRLAMSPSMDSACESLVGKVQWVFTAEGDEKGSSPGTGIYTPKTGDLTPVLFWKLAMLTGGAAFLAMIRFRKRRLSV